MLNQQELKKILNYDHETGIFTWIVIKKGIRANFIAGYKTSDGYLSIGINRKYYKSHRLAWLYMTGNWPSNGIDHINGIKTDNRWCNLRVATQSENLRNVGITKRNKSGYKGVSWHTQSGKWRAQCRLNNKKIYLGVFDTPESASKVYQQFAKQHHGEFFKEIE